MKTTTVSFYIHTCPRCGEAFDVQRAEGAPDREVHCPLDGATLLRAGVAGTPEPTASWGGYLHDHGAGTETHWHGPATLGAA